MSEKKSNVFEKIFGLEIAEKINSGQIDIIFFDHKFTNNSFRLDNELRKEGDFE